MAKRKPLTVRSFVRFAGTNEKIPMEVINADPELRRRVDEGFKRRLEEGLPNLPGMVEALWQDAIAEGQI